MAFKAGDLQEREDHFSGQGTSSWMWCELKLGESPGPEGDSSESCDPRAGEKTWVWPCDVWRQDSSAERWDRDYEPTSDREDLVQPLHRVPGGGCAGNWGTACPVTMVHTGAEATLTWKGEVQPQQGGIQALCNASQCSCFTN